MTTIPSLTVELLHREFRFLSAAIEGLRLPVNSKHRIAELKLALENNRGSMHEQSWHFSQQNTVRFIVDKGWLYGIAADRVETGDLICIEWTNGASGHSIGKLGYLADDQPFCELDGRPIDLASEGHSSTLNLVLGRIRVEAFDEGWLSKNVVSQTASLDF